MAIDTFQELDGKINHVATKVLHLGDQLDSVNGPRARVVDAHRLITHLSEFLSAAPLSSSIFNDPYQVLSYLGHVFFKTEIYLFFRLMKLLILFKNYIQYLKIYHQSKLAVYLEICKIFTIFLFVDLIA